MSSGCRRPRTAHRSSPPSRRGRAVWPGQSRCCVPCGIGEHDPLAPTRLPALDGLRGAAVIAVLAFHFGVPGATGGYLGVDVFFVLSGYLITTLLLGEHARTGGIDLRRFWARRARRLLPGLCCMLVALAVWAAVVGVPSVVSVRGDAVAALGYVANWRFIAAHRGYFTQYGPPSAVLHTWSLAIEEQFYLAFPMLVYFLSLRTLKFVLLTLMIACPLLRIWAYWYGEPFAGYGYYFLTVFRADNLAIGALIAWYEVTGTSRHVAGMARRTLMATALLFPLYAVLIGRDTDIHMALWGHTYLALFYGSLLFMTLQNAGMSRLAFLRSKPAEFFARISYALYLVHTSVLLALSIVSGVSRDVSTWSGRALALSAFCVSLGICWLSFEVYERRLIRFAHRRFVYLSGGRGFGATRVNTTVEFQAADDTVAVADRAARETQRR
jgi:peptidoglycan/LPS O-acetylase OafA/YrhL